MSSYSSELSTAMRAAKQAAQVCHQIYQSMVEVAQKGGREPVTMADYASQAIINHTLRAAFPGDAFLAEESAKEFDSLLSPEQQAGVAQFAGLGLEQVREALSLPSGGGPRTWIIDPIDGTKGFLAKRAYAVVIGLMIEGELALGLMACPNLDLAGGLSGEGWLFYAIKGEGAYRQPLAGGEAIPMHVQSTPPPNETLTLLSSLESGHSNKGLFAQIAAGLPHARQEVIGLDGQGKYGLVANGSAAAYFRLVPDPEYQEKVWDHAAGTLIVQEAGGRVTDFQGRPLNFTLGRALSENRGVVVSNGDLHPHLLRAIEAASS
jgi:3'(2'), 5'-bisphosphate nucleotidase